MEILAVDDDADIRSLVETALKNVGHAVTTTYDGNSALQIANERSFDLVLTDVRMPGMSGTELCSEFRKLEQFKTTPILFMTAQSDNFDYDMAEKAGGTGYVVKPFTLTKLIEVVGSFGTD